ncbi:MAG: EAL domain-containing protein [Leptolyngbya sp. SIO4C1]|nr:EAL domain-containing protein [Leptolyngbya sp. SIO4C1]
MVSSQQLSQEPVNHSHLAEERTIADRTGIDITVVIPTYNGAERLPLVLERLRSQVAVSAFTWEVIVSDNNSTDATAAVVRAYRRSWPALRYCFAAEQGAAFARQRAVEAARGSLIAFLDDDNLPEANWLEQIYCFAQQHPRAGAFGSQIHGQFDGPLPDNFDQIKCFLAIIERGDQPHLYRPETKILPPAAGLVVRKRAWQSAVPSRLFLNNKGKEAGLASEDLEALLHIQNSGQEIWYNPKMVVFHTIPSGRLQKDYLVKLFRCVGLSRFYIRMLGVPDWKRPLLIPAYIANDLRRLTLHYLRQRRPAAKLPLLEACEREYLISTLLSPNFLLKKAATDRAQDWINQLRWPQRTHWLKTLTAAFEEDRFRLYEQPIVAIDAQLSPAVYQRELLLRLSSPEDQVFTLSSQFFSNAEHLGLMTTLDRWVIRQAFFALSQPASSPGQVDQTAYAINLSCSSVQDRHLLDFIDQQLRQSGLAAAQLCFELKEVTALRYPSQTRQLIAGLSALGCQTTLDGFSLRPAVLRTVETRALSHFKLNSQVLSRPGWASRLQQLMAAYPQAQIIANRVETPQLLQQAQQAGILYGQGFQLSKPQPIAAAPIVSPTVDTDV